MQSFIDCSAEAMAHKTKHKNKKAKKIVLDVCKMFLAVYFECVPRRGAERRR